MARSLKTTRPVAQVRTIEDIVAIESHPYDELVTGRNLYDLFRATAEAVGSAKALTVLRSENATDVGASFTHGELRREITRAANMFNALGMTPESGVAALLSPTLPELPALLFGAQVAGIASSLNYLLSPEALRDLLNAQAATILVVPSRRLDAMCWEKASGVLEKVPTLRHVVVIGDETEERTGFVGLSEAMRNVSCDALAFAPAASRDAVCALFHTGGTTGRPKLVRLTHGNHIHAAFGFAQVFGYDEQDVVINGFPFFHVGGTMTVGLSVLAAGGHCIVPSPFALRPPSVIAHYWDIVTHFRATVVSGVPTSIAALANSWKKGADVSAVRMALTGGAVLPKAVGSRFMATTGIPLFETYGMTETAAAIAFNPGRGEPVAGSVGFRAPYSQIRIRRLGGERLELCDPGESGLVEVRGPQVFPGYVDPTHNVGTLASDGWLTTGDVGYLTGDARLVLTGREKDLIVRSGHNIDPAAIEDVANQFEGVHMSAAVGMPDQYAGEVPALFVVAAPGADLDIDRLRAFLDANVSEPPARPKSTTVIDTLPVTAVGKVFKPALRELAIKEKVRLETSRVCGPSATAAVDVRLNARKETVVDVVVEGADAAMIDALDAALKPLPQKYAVRSGGSAQDGPVLLSLDGGIATLTLNRPDKLNALSREVVEALERHLKVLADDPALRAVVITATGRAFCAGGDLLEFEAALKADKEKILGLLRYNQGVLQLVEDLPVPVIGAVNGFAVAGGLELLLCCDILIAAAGARMGDGHTRYGVVPAGGATVRLMEKLSPSRVAQLFYTAALVDAETLERWGVVNEVVPPDRLLERAIELAREVCERSPEAIRHIKALVAREARALTREARMEAELQRFAVQVAGRDLATGLEAFREKRAPRF